MVVFCFEGYWPEMSKEIRCFPHLSALFSSLWYPLSQCFTQPPTPQSQKEVCWWMLKAAPVPQQLTPLLQEAACQVDGISPPLLPVTKSGRACRQIYVFALLFCLQSGVSTSKELWGASKTTKCSSVSFTQSMAMQYSKSVGLLGFKEGKGLRFTRFTRYKHRGTAASCFTWIKVRISSYTTAHLTFYPYLVYLVVQKQKTKKQNWNLMVGHLLQTSTYCIVLYL